MWPSALRDLPHTRSGDAIRAVLATVIMVVVSLLISLAWPDGDNGAVPTALLSGALFCCFMYAWFRRLHRRQGDTGQPPPRA